MALSKLPMSPTIFLHTPTLEEMGIADSMAAMLTHTGFPTLYGMGEFTYLDLTFEFLSSYSYNPKRSRPISFRVCHTDVEITLEVLSDTIGFASEKNV